MWYICPFFRFSFHNLSMGMTNCYRTLNTHAYPFHLNIWHSTLFRSSVENVPSKIKLFENLFQLFGGIIEHGLVNMIPLGLALRFVLVITNFRYLLRTLLDSSSLLTSFGFQPPTHQKQIYFYSISLTFYEIQPW